MMKRLIFSLLFTTIVLAVTSVLIAPVSYGQSDAVVWQPWTDKTVDALSNDNSGAVFSLDTGLVSPLDSPALQITPGGTADETKIAFDVSGEDLQSWNEYAQLQLEIYLPQENELNPNRFFLGMADVSSAWSWVDGVFGSANGSEGWVTITYQPSIGMRQPDPTGRYVLYLSFFNDGATGKPPLTEAFYLGAARLAAPTGSTTVSADARFQAEVDALLQLDDAALLSTVAKNTFDYFWEQANPTNGLVRDRSTDSSPASIAAVGFGLSALTIGVDRGWITAQEAYDRALTTLNTFISGQAAGEHGFFYHFLDMQTGERVWDSELSSIDTALLMAGVLSVGQFFTGTEVDQLAQQLYEAVDWEWMARGQRFISMGWKPDTGFFTASWDHFDESMILYALALASPTHPIPAESWERWRRPVDRVGEFIYLGGEPLFVYQYPLAWLDVRGMEDAHANYFNNTTRACERSQRFSAEHDEAFTTYQGGIWGISASDGPDGYRAYGAANGNHDGTIAPYAAIACLPFTPDASIAAMRAMLTRFGSLVWREYGFVSAINALESWYSDQHIGIDQGDILLMIANHQDSFMWELMAQNPTIQTALDRMGFIASSGDYAVTPAYLQEIRGG